MRGKGLPARLKLLNKLEQNNESTIGAITADDIAEVVSNGRRYRLADSVRLRRRD